jgi:hypothetical protein
MAVSPVEAWAIVEAGKIVVHTVAQTREAAIACHLGDDGDDTIDGFHILEEFGVRVIRVRVAPVD